MVQDLGILGLSNGRGLGVRDCRIYASRLCGRSRILGFRVFGAHNVGDQEVLPVDYPNRLLACFTC